jgi:hypothetical protein
MAEELPEGAKPAAAAAVGAFVGVFLQQDILNVALLSLVAAYCATLTNSVGEVTNTVAGTAEKAYTKAKDFNQEYDVLPKAKDAADTVLSVADNLNSNYGISNKIDERLKLTDKVDDIKDKFNNVKSQVTDKVDELKDSATPK